MASSWDVPLPLMPCRLEHFLLTMLIQERTCCDLLINRTVKLMVIRVWPSIARSKPGIERSSCRKMSVNIDDHPSFDLKLGKHRVFVCSSGTRCIAQGTQDLREAIRAAAQQLAS